MYIIIVVVVIIIITINIMIIALNSQYEWLVGRGEEEGAYL